MTDKELYIKLWKRGRLSMDRIRDKVFPCTPLLKGQINPVCYKFFLDNGYIKLEEIEDMYYTYLMGFVKKKYPARVFALLMTER
jgi:hypothetical protein